MIVGFGRVTPEGRLPVYSVDSEEEAQRLISLACPLNADGLPYARELAVEQTLPNLYAFSDRLEAAHEFMKERGKCTCAPLGKGEKHGR